MHKTITYIVSPIPIYHPIALAPPSGQSRTLIRPEGLFCGMGKPVQSMLCVTSAKVYQDTELAALGIHDHETIVYIICSSCGYTISAG